MTISTTISRISYNGDGVTTIFAVPYTFFGNTEVDVISLVVATQVETTLVLNTDYFVSGGNGSTGTITTLVAPAVGTQLTIARVTNRTQLADYTPNDPFPAEVHERALDRLTAVVQEIDDASTRSLKVPVTSPITDLTLPNPEPNTILGWNGAGTGIENKNIPGGAVVYSSVSTTRAGITTSEAVTPDGLASVWQKGSDIVAAATLTKPADANLGGYHVVTGNTNIGAIWSGEKDGMEIELRFTGTPTLLHSATLSLPTSSNIVVAVGDIARFRSDSSPNWICTDYTRKDGTSLASSASRKPVSVRQTVMYGPVSTTGTSNFGGATLSTTVTATGTLVATAAFGADANGNIDRVGSKVNPSWTGLSTNGTMYKYFDVNANGTLTEGVGTLAPIYQWGGTPSTTNGQFTFNISEMTGYVGNGATAPQTYRVYVGEVTVAGGVVTQIFWYTLNGNYIPAFTATLPNSAGATTFNHLIGTNELYSVPHLEIRCTSADNGYAIGDRLLLPSNNYSTGIYPASMAITSRIAGQLTTNVNWPTPPKGGGASANLTPASWSYRPVLTRGW